MTRLRTVWRCVSAVVVVQVNSLVHAAAATAGLMENDAAAIQENQAEQRQHRHPLRRAGGQAEEGQRRPPVQAELQGKQRVRPRQPSCSRI